MNGEDTNEDRWTPLTRVQKILLPVQLVLSVYLLLLLPAGLACGKCCGAAVLGSLPYEYIAFFGVLLLPRAFRFGKFAKKADAATRKKNRGTNKLDFVLFLMALVGSHWSASYRGGLAGGSSNGTFFLGIRLLAMTLVGASGWTLGKAYDRVTRPHALITTGPYGYVRHPIYTAYIIFFGGSLLSLRGGVEYVVWLATAALFYSARMAAEDELLADTFGDEFDAYKQRVPWKLFPGIY